MSLRIIKAGILDTIQDLGRHGFQHLGINPNGAMDRLSARTANALLGKDLNAPVLEVHFPAAQILFETDTIIAITGADFAPVINGKPVPRDHPLVVAANSLLQFQKPVSGMRAYIATFPDIIVDKWLNSSSTNLKAGAGGFEGRALQRYDCLQLRRTPDLSGLLKDKEFEVLHWKQVSPGHPSYMQFIIGSEWNWLTTEAQQTFQESMYQISPDADRMGYRLTGNALVAEETTQLVSSAVTFGTIQLLPDGKLIILMADHQTTGGYPRIAHVISAHLPFLAQKKINDVLQFRMTDLGTAEKKWLEQEKYIHLLQDACKFKMENVLHATL